MGVIDEKHSGSDRNSTDIRDAEIQYAAEEVQCPSHTTERKLMAKVDMRVVPFLCIMYLLAFLGTSTVTTRSAKYPFDFARLTIDYMLTFTSD